MVILIPIPICACAVIGVARAAAAKINPAARLMRIVCPSYWTWFGQSGVSATPQSQGNAGSVWQITRSRASETGHEPTKGRAESSTAVDVGWALAQQFAACQPPRSQNDWPTFPAEDLCDYPSECRVLPVEDDLAFELTGCAD